MSDRTIEHLEIVADFLEQMTDRDSYAVYVREAAESLARLQDDFRGALTQRNMLQSELARLKNQTDEQAQTIDELDALREREAGRYEREVQRWVVATEKAEAIVDKLPKYTDTGETILPGMTVHFWATHRVSADWTVVTVGNGWMRIKKGKTPLRYLNQVDAYSTRQAAETARREQ